MLLALLVIRLMCSDQDSIELIVSPKYVACVTSCTAYLYKVRILVNNGPFLVCYSDEISFLNIKMSSSIYLPIMLE